MQVMVKRRITGKAAANISPNLRPCCVRSPEKIVCAWIPDLNISDIKPTIPGPAEQPISPKKASRANIAVPPRGKLLLAREKVPGHIIPTESPHRAHPIRESTGYGENTVIK